MTKYITTLTLCPNDGTSLLLLTAPSITITYIYMFGIAETEWTFLEPNSTTAEPHTMTTNNDISPATAGPNIELTTNSKLNSNLATALNNDEIKTPACTCDASMPKLERQTSIDSFILEDNNYRRAPRRIPSHHIRRYSPSPIRRRASNANMTYPALFDKSSYLLDAVGKIDTIVDLPRPSRGVVYITTFPFTNKDVKKWAWLFSVNIEETFLEEDNRSRGRDIELNEGEILGPIVRRARNESPYYDPGTMDIPSIYLSRALNPEIVAEDTKDVSYLIVMQNRHRPAGSKLLVAESRKAAGIVMYYEALKGDSVVFVGAVKGWGEKKVHPKKFRRVESLEEAMKVKGEGFVGVVC